MNGKRLRLARAGSVAVVLFLLAPWVQAATYSGGAGTEMTPWRIGTAADWNTLSTTPADWDKHFLLVADIDFGGASITPIGVTPTLFNGVFDGGGHVLRNGTINLPTQDEIGLFGAMGSGSEIRNLGVENLSVTGNWYVGGLAGFSSGLIESCYVTGSVTGVHSVGGLAGYSQGAINECYSTSMVTGDAGVGGLTGTLKGGEVTLCCATGTVQGSGNVIGGLVGSSNSESTITLSFATGRVTSSGNVVGGLLGGNGTGNTVALCYARGAVSGTERIGGLIGNNGSGKVDSCYATGTVTGTAEVGGLIGRTEVATISSYWDKNRSGQPASAAGESRTTDAMTYPYATNTYSDWDFTVVWAADTEYLVNDGYPYLRDCAAPPNGEEEACGCCQSTEKDLSLKELLKKSLGDWLLVGLSLMTLTIAASLRK